MLLVRIESEIVVSREVAEEAEELFEPVLVLSPTALLLEERDVGFEFSDEDVRVLLTARWADERRLVAVMEVVADGAAIVLLHSNPSTTVLLI